MRTILEVKEEIANIDINTIEGVKEAIEVVNTLPEGEEKQAIITDLMRRSAESAKRLREKFNTPERKEKQIELMEQFKNLLAVPQETTNQEALKILDEMPNDENKLNILKSLLVG